MEETQNFGSITDRNDLDEFLATAELAASEFTAERVHSTDLAGTISNSKILQGPELDKLKLENRHIIRVPRKPDWREFSSGEDLRRAENLAFLDWRKQLASIENQENFVLTPFERNLEMWRQLWRVVEISDLLVQIVDARNPLLFYCEDLVDYAKEVKKDMKFLLLINKADLLDNVQKDYWRSYFDSKGIEFFFFSATLEADESENGDSYHASSHPFDVTSEGLLEYFSAHSPSGNIGMVGYPNVGKSSTINALVGEKKVSVAATPGKTKHFQTLNLENGLTLCDCPGLVFPNISSSRAELVLNGILPVDQLRDFVSPTSMLCGMVPIEVLEAIYGIVLPRPVVEDLVPGVETGLTASDLLSAHATNRGFRTSNFGNPDESRSARIVLKDFVNAKILFCHPPPGVDRELFNASNNHRTMEYYKDRPKPKPNMSEIVDPYLEESNHKIFAKQPSGGFVQNFSRSKVKSGHSDASSSKKHYKKKK